MGIIRNARVTDVSSIMDLTELCVVSAGEGKPGLVDFPVPSREEWRHRILSSEYFVVDEEDEIIGYCAAFPDKVLRDRRDSLSACILPHAPCVYMELVAVHPDCRREGVGSTLVGVVEMSAAEKYPKIITPIVRAPVRNDPSIAAVNKLGYELFKEVHAFGMTFGLYKKDL